MNEKKNKDEVINVKALDALIAEHGHSPEAIVGQEGLLAQVTKALVERALGAELTYHLKTGRNPAQGRAGGMEARSEGASFVPGVAGDADRGPELQFRFCRRNWPPLLRLGLWRLLLGKGAYLSGVGVGV